MKYKRWARLPEFDALPPNWKLVELAEIAEITAGQSPSSETYNEKNQGLPFLQGNADFGDRSPVASVWCTEPSKIAREGSILVSVRAPVGALNRADKNYAIGRGLAALYPTTVDSDYFYYGMHRWRRVLLRAAQGSTFDAVTARQLRQVVVAIPKDESERRAIAGTIGLADLVLEKAKAEFEATRRLKKALMQQLFTRGIPGRHGSFRLTKIGEVPAGWQVARVKDLLVGRPLNGISPQSHPEPPGTPIFNVSCIKEGVCDPLV